MDVTQIFQLPSVDGSEYDLFALAPAQLAPQDAKRRIDQEIVRANTEDARNDLGGCADGLTVADSIKRALTLEGFVFFQPQQSMAFDGNIAAENMQDNHNDTKGAHHA